MKQTSKKKDEQSYVAEICCVRQELNSEANILHNEPVLLQAGYFIMSSPEQPLNNDLKIEDNN